MSALTFQKYIKNKKKICKKDLKKIKKCSINNYSGNNINRKRDFQMMKNVKKIIVSLVAMMLVVCTACTVFATQGSQSILDEINEMLQNQNGTIGENEPVEEIPEGENNNEVLNTNTNLASGSTNTSENLPETTPHAGLEDYSGLIFVAIFAVSAIYAYKKIREYNA